MRSNIIVLVSCLLLAVSGLLQASHIYYMTSKIKIICNQVMYLNIIDQLPTCKGWVNNE
jgi:hypothetical protein